MVIIYRQEVIMVNIISLFQEIFLGKEVSSIKVGLSEFKEVSLPVKNKSKNVAKELKLSELMKKSSY